MKKQKTEKLKTNKGITLIALVITIIVMLILVSVTISMAVNGGLFDYAKKAASGMQNARDKEQQLADLAPGMTVDELINKFTNSEGGTGSGVIPVPDEEDVFESFDVGVEEGTVTAYVVKNEEATASAGAPVYDVLIIGNGEMRSAYSWNSVNAHNHGDIDGAYPNWAVDVKNVIISDGVTGVGRYAFSCCNLTSVTIPNSVTTIEDNVFKYCENLTNVTIPNTVTAIGRYAFHNCTSLTSITLPVDLSNVDEKAFSGCYNLSTINYRGTEAQWGDKIFDGLAEPYINYNYNG